MIDTTEKKAESLPSHSHPGLTLGKGFNDIISLGLSFPICTSGRWCPLAVTAGMQWDCLSGPHAGWHMEGREAAPPLCNQGPWVRNFMNIAGQVSSFFFSSLVLKLPAVELSSVRRRRDYQTGSSHLLRKFPQVQRGKKHLSQDNFCSSFAPHVVGHNGNTSGMSAVPHISLPLFCSHLRERHCLPLWKWGVQGLGGQVQSAHGWRWAQNQSIWLWSLWFSARSIPRTSTHSIMEAFALARDECIIWRR